jgi:hypothetical protein
MGMALKDYEDITLAAFLNKLAGFYELEQQKQKNDWQRFDYLAWMIEINNPYIKANMKAKTLTEFQNRKKKKTIKRKLTKKQFEDFIE